MPITTQRQLRAAFWGGGGGGGAHPDFDFQARQAGIRSKSQNHQCATVRCAWVDWIDGLQRNGEISQSLAQRATL